MAARRRSRGGGRCNSLTVGTGHLALWCNGRRRGHFQSAEPWRWQFSEVKNLTMAWSVWLWVTARCFLGRWHAGARSLRVSASVVGAQVERSRRCIVGVYGGWCLLPRHHCTYPRRRGSPIPVSLSAPTTRHGLNWVHSYIHTHTYIHIDIDIQGVNLIPKQSVDFPFWYNKMIFMDNNLE